MKKWFIILQSGVTTPLVHYVGSPRAQKGLILCSCAHGGGGLVWAPTFPCSPGASSPPGAGWDLSCPGLQSWEETTSSKIILLSVFKGVKSTPAGIPPSQHSQEGNCTFMLLKRAYFFLSEQIWNSWRKRTLLTELRTQAKIFLWKVMFSPSQNI